MSFQFSLRLQIIPVFCYVKVSYSRSRDINHKKLNNQIEDRLCRLFRINGPISHRSHECWFLKTHANYPHKHFVFFTYILPGKCFYIHVQYVLFPKIVKSRLILLLCSYN